MTNQHVIYSYKGYNYKHISLYKNPNKDNVFHVVAGLDEHTTPFYFTKTDRGIWKLMIDCEVCDACLESFTSTDTASDRKESAMKALTKGVYITEGYSDSMEAYTGHYYAHYN
jgi:hypothetical protein